MRAAPRDEFSKGNEWRIYDYVTRHFIGTLHDDCVYLEKAMQFDINRHRFTYTWHEVVDRGFTFAMPWKFKALGLNELEWKMPQLRDGDAVSVSHVDVRTEHTKPPDYLQESELIALMDKHRIGTDASIPQHIKNICDRHYVDVCGPSGEDGTKGALIPQRPNFGNQRGGRGGGKDGGQQRASSRHMVPRAFGLAFFSCFEELDRELCDPPIRAYMEQQCGKIATREVDKNEVVTSNLKLFLEKFLAFRSGLSKVDRFFAPKNMQLQGGGTANGYYDGGGGGGGNQQRGGGRGGGGGGGGGGGRGGDYEDDIGAGYSSFEKKVLSPDGRHINTSYKPIKIGQYDVHLDRYVRAYVCVCARACVNNT